MTNTNNISIDTKGVTKPLTKLVEVIGQGIGKVYQPFGTVIQAKADASARLITAKSEIAENELWQRANERNIYVEMQRQRNLEAIVNVAHKALPAQVKAEPVNHDWITHFFDAAKDVSDSELQSLWARILADEVATPGNTSRRTLEFLKTLSKDEANMFVVLLSVSFFVKDDNWRFIISDKITFEKIREATGGIDISSHMADIGILSTESTMVDVTQIGSWRFNYGSKNYRFKCPPPRHMLEEQFGLPGKLMEIHSFSLIGAELSLVAEQEFVPDFVESLSRKMETELEVSIVNVDDKEAETKQNNKL